MSWVSWRAFGWVSGVWEEGSMRMGMKLVCVRGRIIEL